MPLHWPDFQPDLDELRAAVSDRTRVILVNDPHNPTGAVFSRKLQDEVIPLAERHDAVIVTGLRLPPTTADGCRRRRSSRRAISRAERPAYAEAAAPG